MSTQLSGTIFNLSSICTEDDKKGITVILEIREHTLVLILVSNSAGFYCCHILLGVGTKSPASAPTDADPIATNISGVVVTSFTAR